MLQELETNWYKKVADVSKLYSFVRDRIRIYDENNDFAIINYSTLCFAEGIEYDCKKEWQSSGMYNVCNFQFWRLVQ